MSSLFSPSSTKAPKPFSTKEGGFGLIELMVSISIMMVISAVIMARHSSFNGAVLLRSQAYEIALSIREVQMSAVSAESNGSGSFRATEGVYFNTSSPTQYQIFRDADNDSFYDSSEQYGKQGIIEKRFEIRAIRAVGDTVTGTGLAVVFERPNFDAKFFDSAGQVNASSVEIDLAKKDAVGNGPDVVKTIEITGTGQITVK